MKLLNSFEIPVTIYKSTFWNIPEILKLQELCSNFTPETCNLITNILLFPRKKYRCTESVEITKKMQHCNRIYYSKNLLKAQHVSSGTSLVINSSELYLQPLVYIHMWWLAVFQAGWETSLDNGRSPHVYINQMLQIQFGAPDDERCAARNMLSLQ